ncbi:MAG TPA: histidine kinase [Candidatus Deferrimicrobium sp.]|nr:histidine kinase [Candidatus Deferrimicrobium sp.]
MTTDSAGRTADSWLRRRPLVVDLTIAAVVAVLVAPASLSLVWESGWSVPGQLALTAIVVLASASVALRRVRMRSAFVAVSLSMLVLAFAPALGGEAAGQMGGEFAPILLPCSLSFPVVLYAVAAYASGREALAALAVAVMGAAVTTLRLWDNGDLATGVPTGTAWRLFIFGAMLAAVIAPWALGRFRSVHEAYVDTLEAQSLRAAQDRLDEAERAAALERSRITREMHDIVAHSLSVMVSQAEGGRLAAQRNPAIVGPVLSTIAATGREALTEMRGLLGVLGAGGVSPGDRAPQPALSDLGALVDRLRAAGTPIELTISNDPGELGRLGELTAYRVVQEALTNVVKHAGPGAQATVDLSWTTAGLNVEVSDNGPAVAAVSAEGRGLSGMRERVDLVGGEVQMGPHGDRGYLVRARIPQTAQTAQTAHPVESRTQ